MADPILDVRGLSCPLPLLKLKQQMTRLLPGDRLQVFTTDPGSVRDFQSYLKQAGHHLLSFSDESNHFIFVIEKAGS